MFMVGVTADVELKTNTSFQLESRSTIHSSLSTQSRDFQHEDTLKHSSLFIYCSTPRHMITTNTVPSLNFERAKNKPTDILSFQKKQATTNEYTQVLSPCGFGSVVNPQRLLSFCPFCWANSMGSLQPSSVKQFLHIAFFYSQRHLRDILQCPTPFRPTSQFNSSNPMDIGISKYSIGTRYHTPW